MLVSFVYYFICGRWIPSPLLVTFLSFTLPPQKLRFLFLFSFLLQTEPCSVQSTDNTLFVPQGAVPPDGLVTAKLKNNNYKNRRKYKYTGKQMLNQMRKKAKETFFHIQVHILAPPETSLKNRKPFCLVTIAVSYTHLRAHETG